ncbi:MAG: DNA-protecting protein DprA [Planctomycetota bacterium]|nr:MAG: DNA-protecting protein DprA [Planctomycetota bacterium]
MTRSSPDSDADAGELADALRLALVTGVGPRLRKVLLEAFGSPGDALSATASQLRAVPGIGSELARRIASAREDIDVEAELRTCAKHDIQILSEAHQAYPRMLTEIHDPPGILFVQGTFEPVDALAVAIVGSRHATHYGIAQAERLAGSLARAGLTIVSGLARGIDAAAHRGALAAGGRTIAVLGSGLLNIYPPEHVELAREVVDRGALVSEVPPASPPMSGAFPQRNRIISGLSLGVMVVEAAARSGALISARHAMEQGREVFAVPGRIDSRMSRGCHRLIRDGAKLVESADDVLEELGPLVAPAATTDGQEVRHPAELALNPIEQQVLSAIASDPTTIDAIVTDSGLPTPQVLSTISVLEMRHLVRRLSGNTLVRL